MRVLEIVLPAVEPGQTVNPPFGRAETSPGFFQNPTALSLAHKTDWLITCSPRCTRDRAIWSLQVWEVMYIENFNSFS
jgi:hypothetical protein